MGSQHNHFDTPKIYLIDNDMAIDAALTGDLAERTDTLVKVFTSIEQTRAADTPALLLVDSKAIADEQDVHHLRSRFPVPMIVLCGRPSLAQAVKAMRYGACDFFPKPVGITALAERISGLLKNRSMVTAHHDHAIHPPLVAPFWEQERDIIESALTSCNGNISQAAAALKISPSTIYRKRQSWA